MKRCHLLLVVFLSACSAVTVPLEKKSADPAALGEPKGLAASNESKNNVGKSSSRFFGGGAPFLGSPYGGFGGYPYAYSSPYGFLGSPYGAYGGFYPNQGLYGNSFGGFSTSQQQQVSSQVGVGGAGLGGYPSVFSGR